MKFNFEIIKKHPWAWGVGLLALFIILYLSMAGSSSSQAAAATTTASGGIDQQTADQLALQSEADQTQLQGAQISAGVANNQISAQATTQQEQYALQYQEAQLGAAVQDQQTTSQAQVDEDELGAQVAETNTVYGSEVQIAGLNAGLQRLISNNNTQVNLAQINTENQIAQANAAVVGSVIGGQQTIAETQAAGSAASSTLSALADFF